MSNPTTDTKSRSNAQALKLGAIAIVGVAAVFGIWRLSSGNKIPEPAASPPASAPTTSSGSIDIDIDAARAIAAGTGSAAVAVPDASTARAPQVYPTATSSMQKIGLPLRPMDLEILALIASGDIKNTKDALPNKPYRVTMVRDQISGYIISVSIDLTRSGSVDERWKLTPEQVVRHTRDEHGKFLDDYWLRGGRWQPR